MTNGIYNRAPLNQPMICFYNIYAWYYFWLNTHGNFCPKSYITIMAHCVSPNDIHIFSKHLTNFCFIPISKESHIWKFAISKFVMNFPRIFLSIRCMISSFIKVLVIITKWKITLFIWIYHKNVQKTTSPFPPHFTPVCSSFLLHW